MDIHQQIKKLPLCIENIIYRRLHEIKTVNIRKQLINYCNICEYNYNPYKKCNCPREGIYLYSFTLYPERYQPSGTVSYIFNPLHSSTV